MRFFHYSTMNGRKGGFNLMNEPELWLYFSSSFVRAFKISQNIAGLISSIRSWPLLPYAARIWISPSQNSGIYIQGARLVPDDATLRNGMHTATPARVIDISPAPRAREHAFISQFSEESETIAYRTKMREKRLLFASGWGCRASKAIEI